MTEEQRETWGFLDRDELAEHIYSILVDNGDDPVTQKNTDDPTYCELHAATMFLEAFALPYRHEPFGQLAAFIAERLMCGGDDPEEAPALPPVPVIEPAPRWVTLR